MDINFHKYSLLQKDILLVGFRGYENFEPWITDSRLFSNYRFQSYDNSFRAYQWLESQARADKGDISSLGIICNLEYLEKDNYQLLQYLKNNPLLKNIPLIALSADPIKMDRAEALRMGIDDVFMVPVSSKTIEMRLDFLRKHKKEILKKEKGKGVSFKEWGVPLPKRIFDILFSATILLLISPLLLLIAALIKLESRGPIFYISKRVGTKYNIFNFFKFRSMYVGADQKLVQFAHLNQYAMGNGAGTVSFVKLKNDPRITWVGRFIRKTSLDELPQLFNVLQGDMSVVGNRPLPLYEAEKLTQDEWAKRFLAPAGLTGLWQVSDKGKDNMSAEERIALDIQYANEYSFSMDLRIISKTLPAMIQKEG